MYPLPYSWPAALPFWIALWWAFAAEWPFVRQSRAAAPSAADKGSKNAIVIANGIGAALAFGVAGRPGFAMTSLRVPGYAAGIACLIAGGLLRRHCFRMLGESFTYEVRVGASQRVVERGAYKYVRHPSYTAGLLMFGGIGLALGNWLSLACAFGCSLAGYAYRIAVEERALVAALGPAYSDYMKRTRRLIPFVF